MSGTEEQSPSEPVLIGDVPDGAEALALVWINSANAMLKSQ